MNKVKSLLKARWMSSLIFLLLLFLITGIAEPVWWNLAPRVVNSFIEQHDLSGKRIIPFATSGSSSIAGSVAALRRSYPELEWSAGRLLNGMSREAVADWARSAAAGRN